MKENRGLALVELLITVAILSIVIVIAGTFMTTSSRSFARGNADTDVQREAELAVNQIEDLIIDVNGGVAMTDDAAKTELLLHHTEDGSGGMPVYKKRAVTWNKTSGNIECSEWNMIYDSSADDYVEDGSAIYAGQLLADNVTNFVVDLSDAVVETGTDGSDITIIKSISIRVDCEDATGNAAYATSPIITLRNRMMLSSNAKEIFDLTPATDTTLQLYISDNSIDTAVPIIDRVTPVNRKGIYNIFAMVNLGANVNALVDWEIEEMNSISTIDENGVLSVGEYEPNEYLTITARYKSNPNKKATGVVRVQGDPKTLGVEIYTRSLLAFNPKYGSYVTPVGYTPEETARLVYKWTVSEPERMENYVDNTDKLELKIKKEAANYGKTITITLVVTSPDTGQSASDYVTYRIDNEEVTYGDNYMMRGYGDNQEGYGTTWFSYQMPFWTQSVGFDYYFCDEYGNEITVPESLRDCVVVNEIAGQHGNYWLTFTADLPADHQYYIKVICTYHNMYNFTNDRGDVFQDVSYERIHEIPAVRLYGEVTHAENVTVWGGFDVYYNLVGFHSLKWNLDPPVYEYTVEELVYDAPEGVTVEAVVSRAEARTDTRMWAMGTFKCSNLSMADAIVLKSAKIKISLKEYPEIYTYSTVIFN